ncbi:MAG: rod shape-determining protein MreC [Thermomicrobiales bacterium]
MTTLSARQTVMLVVLFVVLSFTFISLDNNRTLDPLKSGLHDSLVPVTDAFNKLGSRGQSDSEMAKELERTKKERDALLAENANLKAQAAEVKQLQDQLDVQQEHPEWQLLSARVINPDPSSLEKFITIDKGSKDGIQVGMAVTDPSYFIGQVTSVEEHSARVTLAIDMSFRVGAKLIDTGSDGIAYGMWQKQGRMEMRHIDRDAKPKDQEVVVTASSSDVKTAKVPGGLVIGKVDGEPTLDNQTDSLTIKILPVADFDNLKVVAIILNGQDA